MDNSTYVSLSLATAMQRELDVTANNIANANTAGFKAEKMLFESYLHEPDSPELTDPTSFVIDRGSYADAAQGPLTRTGNPLDIALKGKGWFSYQTPDGQLVYGRDGRFNVDPQGNLVTLSGSQVLDSGGGPIALPAEAMANLTVSPDGTISSEATGAIAQIGIFDLPDLESYRRVGNGQFLPPQTAGRQAPLPATGTELAQGMVEESNVQPVVEMTRLMMIQQAYDRSMKLISNEDDLKRDMLRRMGQA